MTSAESESRRMNKSQAFIFEFVRVGVCMTASDLLEAQGGETSEVVWSPEEDAAGGERG